MVADRDPGGLLVPDNTSSRTGRPVIDILQEKRPEARIPAASSFHEHLEAEDCLETLPTLCYEDNIAERVANLTRGAGPCGVEETMLRNWLLRHEIRSKKLREEMALWTPQQPISGVHKAQRPHCIPSTCCTKAT